MKTLTIIFAIIFTTWQSNAQESAKPSQINPGQSILNSGWFHSHHQGSGNVEYLPQHSVDTFYHEGRDEGYSYSEYTYFYNSDCKDSIVAQWFNGSPICRHVYSYTAGQEDYSDDVYQINNGSVWVDQTDNQFINSCPDHFALFRTWDGVQWDTISGDKSITGYDIFNNPSETDFYAYGISAWHLKEKAIYHYDTGNKLVSITYYNVDQNTGALILSNRDVSLIFKNYDSFCNNLLTQKTNQVYNQDTKTWENNSIFIYSGAASDLSTNDTTVELLWKDNAYQPVYREITATDIHDNIVFFSEESMDTISGKWLSEYEETYVYTYGTNNEILSRCTYNLERRLDKPYLSAITHYSNFISCGSITGISNFASENKFEVFPNPAKDRLQIKMPVANSNLLVLYDIMGKEVQLVPINRGHDLQISVDISHLPPGIYFVKEPVSGGWTGKFIKE